MPSKRKDSSQIKSKQNPLVGKKKDMVFPQNLELTILNSVISGMLRIEPVIMTDSNGIINFWNPASEMMFGYTKEEILGTHIKDLFYDSHFQQIFPLAQDDLPFGKENEDDYTGRIYELTAKGRFIERIPLEVQLSHVVSDGQKFVVLIVRNLTDRMLQFEELKKAKEEAEKANRLKSEFLSNMSHEIRTPMNAILGFADIVLNSIENEEHKEHLRIIQQSGKNLMSLLNDILDLSKIEAERMVLQQKEFSLRRLLNEVHEVFSLQASNKNIKFTIEISEETPDMYIGDEQRLRQILINFLSNAFKFTMNDGVVKVHFRYMKGIGYFEIQDTGIGIPPDKIHTIFNAFEQIDGTYTRQYSGTGLGLAITRRLVELMEGRIDVVSEEQVGSTFKVQIKMPVFRGTEEGRESDLDSDSKFKNVLKSTEKYRRGTSMVKKWIQFAEGDQDIEEIIFEAISLLPEKLEELITAVQERDEKRTDFLTHSLKGETLNLHLNEVAKFAKKMNDTIRQSSPDWSSIDYDLDELKDLISLIPVDYLEKHKASKPSVQINKRDRILVAEDNVMNQKLMKTIIEKLGFECDLASNGLFAWNMLMENKYLMLLLDMQMPHMDGLDLIKVIREDNQMKNLYVVAVTAYAMKGDKERFLSAGCNEYLPKPIDFDKLSKVIENTLKFKQAEYDTIR